MGLISKIGNYIRGSNTDQVTVARLINLLANGYSPLSIFGRDLDNIPEVRTAVNFVAEKVASLPIYHIKEDEEGTQKVVRDAFDWVLRTRPNDLQTPTVFMTRTISQLWLSNNAFVLPEWENNGNLKALYPVPLQAFKIQQDKNGLYDVHFAGFGISFPYSELIHLQRFPRDNRGAEKQATGSYVTVVNSMQTQAVKDADSSGRISAILKTTADLKSRDMKAKLEEFKDLFQTAENTTGMGMIGGTYDIQELKLKSSPMDVNLLNAITSNLLNYFGVSKELINGTATELQNEQFVDYPIKPLVKQINEEFTYKLLSKSEIKQGHKLTASTQGMEISTMAAKTQFIDKFAYHGFMSGNEARRIVDMPRGPKELDRYRPNLNAVDSTLIDKYQTGEEK